MANPINLDLRNTATFDRVILSPAEGAERLNILVNEIGVEALSPRSQRETKQLDELYSAPNLPHKTVVIRRGFWLWQFYKIDCTITEQADSLRSQIRGLNQSLNLLSNVQTGVSILEALNDSSPKTQLYREQTQMQMNGILGSDFVDSLQGSYRVNISLLRAASLLHQNPDIFNTLINLHQEANGLYGVQETFNRSCELRILEHAKFSTGLLNQLKNLIENEGYDVLNPSEKFLKTFAEIVNEEANKTIAFHRAIQESATLFIDKFEVLKQEIESCIPKLVSSASDIQEMQNKLQLLDEKRANLAKSRPAMEAKLQAFQQARQSEIASRRTERVKKSFLFISWNKSRVRRDDFGSSSLYQQYLHIQREMQNFERSIRECENFLAEKTREYGTVDPSNLEDLEQASRP